MAGKGHLSPVRDDDKVESLLNVMVADDADKLAAIMEQFRDTVVQTESDGQPEVFAYAKAMNFLRSGDVGLPEMVHLLAAAMWKLHGQNNAEIFVLKADGEVLKTIQETDRNGRE